MRNLELIDNMKASERSTEVYNFGYGKYKKKLLEKFCKSFRKYDFNIEIEILLQL